MTDRGGGERWSPGRSHPVQPSETPGQPRKRVKVVLAERKRARRVVRTLAEVEEQTGVGELLVRQLIRAQLSASLWLALIVAALLGSLPAAFYYFDDLGEVSLVGVRLPWLVLGFGVYPFLLGVGAFYVRLAERNELNFIDAVED